MHKKLIFIELNEINFDLVKKYSEKYKFKVFNKVFLDNLKTTSSEEKYEMIEPWIQWVSVHTGLDAKQHKVFRLGDINNTKLKQIFEDIENLGYKVGAVCPMNTKNSLKNSKYFLPDPWTQNQNPKNFFQNKIYKALSEAVNKNSGNLLSFSSIITILFAFAYFVRFKKYYNLISLFLKSFKNKWYKALIFDFLINEIHINFIKKYNSDFSTIFFNAGAHIQHHYLHNSEIITASKKNPNWYVNKNTDPIYLTYNFYDKLIYEYMNMEKYSILIATGLTQIPHVKSTFYYRLKNHKEFFHMLGINFNKVETRMSRDFVIFFDNLYDSKFCEEILININNLNKKQIFEFDNRGLSTFVSLVFEDQISLDTSIKIGPNENINLFKYVNFVAIKNGKHSPKGFLYKKGDINNIDFENNLHVKNIYNLIKRYFS